MAITYDYRLLSCLERWHGTLSLREKFLGMVSLFRLVDRCMYSVVHANKLAKKKKNMDSEI